MSVDVIRLTAADWDEGLAFLNEVFGEHHPHDFATLLPSIYQPTDEFMSWNHAVREGGRIRAVVGLFPIDWQVGDVVLKVGGIGGVSTHRSVRGKGYMKVLMAHCAARMKAEGFHLSWLGGQRQRYGYFGYEKCGPAPAVTLGPANVRHAFGTEASIRFEPLAAGDAQRLEAARRLHDAQPVRCRRAAATFHRFLVSWYHKPYAALDAGGAMVGYLVANDAADTVYELLARDADAALDVARSWVQRRDPPGPVRFELPPTDYALLRRLGAIGESALVSHSGNWQLYDWAVTVQALLRASAAGGALADGEVRLGIEGYGTLCLRVGGGEPACARTDDSPAVTWHPFTAMRVLFGPLPPAAVSDIPRAAAPLRSWCPLPLAWPRQDGV